MRHAMPFGVIIAALLALGIGELLKRWLISKWTWVDVQAKAIRFPMLCPVCLSPDVDSPVVEQSSKRQTAYYVIARKLEWWRVSVPHCSLCARKIARGNITGVVLGGICAVAAFVAFPPSEASLVTLCYALFGYPAYAVATVIQKGIILGRGGPTEVRAYIRRRSYFAGFAALNPSARVR